MQTDAIEMDVIQTFKNIFKQKMYEENMNNHKDERQPKLVSLEWQPWPERNINRLLRESCGGGITPRAGIDSILEEVRQIKISTNIHIIIFAVANNISNGQVELLCKRLKISVISLRPCSLTIASVPLLLGTIYPFLAK